MQAAASTPLTLFDMYTIVYWIVTLYSAILGISFATSEGDGSILFLPITLILLWFFWKIILVLAVLAGVGFLLLPSTRHNIKLEYISFQLKREEKRLEREKEIAEARENLLLFKERQYDALIQEDINNFDKVLSDGKKKHNKRRNLS